MSNSKCQPAVRVAVLIWAAGCGSLSAATVHIAVFSLFHPTELWTAPTGVASLRIDRDGARSTLEGARIAKFRMGQARSIRVTSPDGGAAEFHLIVPGKIDRSFRGTLLIAPAEGELVATIDMDLEVAVASVVAAESVPGAGIEALKAQAVVGRSFYLGSRARHTAFDFCDTTHCQFLRATPALGAAAQRAAEETRGLVLTYHERVFAAFYSAACGGHTRALQTSTGYPYFAVDCAYCLAHPNDPVRGHRLGMCQSGASGMAAHGSSFTAILNHYYPATVVTPSPTGTSQTPSKFTKKQSTVMVGNVRCRNVAARASSEE